MNIQSEMSERAIELLQLPEDQVQVNKILQLVNLRHWTEIIRAVINDVTD